VQVPAPFELIGDHVRATLSGGTVLFTTRRGGTSGGPYASLNLGRWTDDEPEAVSRNRHILATHLDRPLEDVVNVRQVHGTRVERIATRREPQATPPEADGLATTDRAAALLVLTADCLPIAVVGRHAVAMLHGGWRGLAGGIVAEGVRALRELGDDGELHAAIGPGAGGCCYEVGEEVRAAFAAYADGAKVDLKAAARAQLEAAGVVQVHDVKLCTLCADPSLLFSHRRDGGVTGRQAGVVWRS
jgi:YfiH family protein